MEQKQENKRVCDECHERPTINPKHPYCAHCLGAMGRKSQLEKAQDIGEAKKPQGKPAETFTVGIQITIPADLLRLIAQRR